MKKKILPWIISLSALSVSGSAAFYSVSGLGKMFAGASLQVMVLAGSLEFAKLVTASLLYQYWKEINRSLKIYLTIAMFILILITSAGIYGFLSSAYQETAFKVQNQDKSIVILDKKISIIQGEIKNLELQSTQKNSRLVQITNIRSNLQNTQDVLIEKSKSTNAVRQQIKDIDSEIKRIDSEASVLNDSISSKNSRISATEIEKLNIASNSDLAKEVGPLKYIAELTGKTLEQVVNWYIIILMIVFDPLAIALVIAANFSFEKAVEKDEEKIEKELDNVLPEHKEVLEFKEEVKKGIPIVFTKKNNNRKIKITDLPIKEKIEKSVEVSNENKDTYNIKSQESKEIKEIRNENPLSLR